MSEVSLSAAVRGLLWAGAGAGIALAVVYTVGAPGRQSASAPTQSSADSSEALRARLTALEQDVANDRKRLEAERARLEAERTRMQVASVAAAPVPATVSASPVAASPVVVPRASAAPAKTKPATRPVEPKIAAAPVEAPRPASEAPRPAEQAPVVHPKRAPTSAEVLASAEGLSARGNYAEAAAMLKPLADQGNVKAQSRLGQMYLEGQGVERNEQEGLRLARNAANLGDAEAQLRIGSLYEQGRGLPQNNFQAYIWYSAAARSGYAAATAPRDRVAGTLQAVEIEQAGKLAAGIVRQSKER